MDNDDALATLLHRLGTDTQGNGEQMSDTDIQARAREIAARRTEDDARACVLLNRWMAGRDMAPAAIRFLQDIGILNSDGCRTDLGHAVAAVLAEGTVNK